MTPYGGIDLGQHWPDGIIPLPEPMLAYHRMHPVTLAWEQFLMKCWHFNDAWHVMGKMASRITCLTIVYSTVYLSADLRKHQSSAPLAFVRGIHRGPVNSPHKGPVTRKMFPFDDVIIMILIRNIYEFKDYTFTITAISPRGQRIKTFANMALSRWTAVL